MGDLFLVGRADIFAIYPKIFKDLLQIEDVNRLNTKDGILQKDFLYLPSDAEFQERVYYRLLEVQKEINELIDSGMPAEEIAAKREKPIWDPSSIDYRISPIISPASGSSLKRKHCVFDDPLSFLNLDDLNVWSIEDVTKAGKLLRKPPIECQFFDEHEMRRVYSMIYDVFRYKHVLNQALHDVGFYAEYPELVNEKSRIWLLLYDLHLRHFLKRDPKDWMKQKYLFKEADLNQIDKLIWKERISLAAGLSRLRIKNSALNLSELLPFHLQEEKVAIAAANPITTGWINPCKMRTKNGAKQCMITYGFRESEETEDGQVKLIQSHFKWDKVCPLFLSCIPPDRNVFSQSELLLQNQFILQNRAFSLGPALCSRLLDYFEIEGDIVQTQITSPRSTAYLAALFQCNNRVNDFIVFGAGPKAVEYRQFMIDLGIKHVHVYAENFCNINLDSTVLDKVVGVFATPPNSYSGVTDPIDLICSRGGDLKMLEVLTESEMSNKGKQRVAQVLDEQRETLRLSMSRPQVQFVLYETHSVVDSENEVMVKYAIDAINKSAQSKHIKIFKEKRRLEALAEQEGISMEQWEKLQGFHQTTSTSKRKLKQAEEQVVAQKYVCDTESSDNSSGIDSDTEQLDTSRSKLSKKSTATSATGDEYCHIKIPKTDLFEMTKIPDVCLFQDKCVNFREHGCFLALMKRKHVTRLDEKYLILMAERRGLFGDTSPKKGGGGGSGVKSRPPTKMQKTKDEKQKPNTANMKKSKRKKSDDITILIERLSQPTHSSIIRSQKLRKSSADNAMLVFSPIDCVCEREQERFISEKRLCQSSTEAAAASSKLYSNRVKSWWIDTTKYITQTMEKSKSEGDLDKLYNDIKGKKIPSLQLQRHYYSSMRGSTTVMGINSEHNKGGMILKSPSSMLIQRDLFPVTTNYVEFQEYRTPKLNFANVPFMVENNYWEKAKCRLMLEEENSDVGTKSLYKFRSVGYPSLRTSYSRP